MNSAFRFRARFAWYLVAAVVAGVLLYLVAPILSTFLYAAILAYICLPLGDRMAKSVPRWLAASIVLVLLLPRLTTGGAAVIGFFTTVLGVARKCGPSGRLAACARALSGQRSQ